ncbi:MAG: radical SAM protein [Nanoarchaeota archaeon]|nr:radical SAM protein [Nanoarchaeota archaeon]
MKEFIETTTKSILNKYKEVDSWFQCRYSFNPYRGCQHGCSYCDGRSKKYWPKGGNETFDSKIEIKINAAELLAKKLPTIKEKEVICVGGGVTDVYQPAEHKYGITRKCLQVILNKGFPCHILTKSDLVLRDLDLLKKLSAKNFCAVTFSFSTTDDKLSNVLEHGATRPSRRLAAMNELNKQGIITGACLMPVVPFITDSDELLDKSILDLSNNGANYVMHSPMTLCDDQEKFFMEFLAENFSENLQDLKEKYKYLYRYGYSPDKDYTKRLGERVRALLRNHGMREKMPKFRPKTQDEMQMSLV